MLTEVVRVVLNALSVHRQHATGDTSLHLNVCIREASVHAINDLSGGLFQMFIGAGQTGITAGGRSGGLPVDATGLFDNQSRGGDIPDVKTHLVESIHRPAGYLADIQCGCAENPDFLHVWSQ